MGRLITAEFRKIFTVKLWWALLIPAVLLSLGFTWAGSALGTLGELQEEVGGAVPFALPAFAQGINFTTVFAVILGATAVTSEMRHKTITTTYLTGSSRGAVLTAKLITYTVMGLVYGVACMGAATLGALFGGDLPDGALWFELAGVGVLALMMWTLLGVGAGALIGNQTGAIVGLVIYTLILEPIVAQILRSNDAEKIPFYLPNGSGSGMVSDLSLDLFVEGFPGGHGDDVGRAIEEIRGFLNLDGAPAWWASMLIFLAWSAVIGLSGWLVAKQRDIT
ncbi:ABC transporter permease [Thermocrispum municipale]|jgi:ABC-type transport system involved in multi-copper enzyme maturation permease subunit|uniref:ABC transporter permease n=1 Tax=Thermocrispum municipale TaxID=37926 RepID=UPI00041FF857|nr:ABC transporter permease subunit [Thermocrispum municipale]